MQEIVGLWRNFNGPKGPKPILRRPIEWGDVWISQSCFLFENTLSECETRVKNSVAPEITSGGGGGPKPLINHQINHPSPLFHNPQFVSMILLSSSNQSKTLMSHKLLKLEIKRWNGAIWSPNPRGLEQWTMNHNTVTQLAWIGRWRRSKNQSLFSSCCHTPKNFSPLFTFHLTFGLRFICTYLYQIQVHHSFMLALLNIHNRFKVCG